MSDDDLPDLVDKATGQVVDTRVKQVTFSELKQLSPLGCASPAVEEVKRPNVSKQNLSPIDPSTGRDSNGYSELHWAVYTGNESRAQEILDEQLFDVNDASNEKKQTPLLWAAVMGRTRLCYLLVEKGAFLEYVDFEGFSALSLAVQNGHVLLTHLLCEMGAEPSVLDKDSHNLAHWAVYRNQNKVLAYLLRFRGVDVNGTDVNGATPLHWAAMRNSSKCVSVLLENGARTDLRDGANKTALEIAWANKYSSICRDIEASMLPEPTWFGLSRAKQLFYFPLILIPLCYAFSMSISTLFVIPWIFSMWYGVKTGLAWKHIQGPGGFRSAWPYGAMSATCVGVYYFNLRYIIWTLDQPLVHIAFHIFMAGMFLFLIPFRNVGFVPLNRRLSALEWSQVRPELFCPFCSIQQPVRAHHCRRCNRCVARFDHHCPWVDSCVGFGNNHIFIPMITCGAICHVIFAIQGYQFLALQFFAAESVREFWSSWGPFIVFWLFEFVQLFGEWFLIYGQIRGAMSNLTTLEQMGLMQHGDKPNPFDKGTSRNLKQFFRLLPKNEHVDYLTEFEGPMFDFEPHEV